jgi:hypothetical protein
MYAPLTKRGNKSGPRSDGHLLAQVRDGSNRVREPGSWGGELYGELRGSVHGCEHDGFEAFGGVEGAGGRVSGTLRWVDEWGGERGWGGRGALYDIGTWEGRGAGSIWHGI